MKMSAGKVENPNLVKPAKRVVKSRGYAAASARRYYTPEEVMGENWRDGLDKIKDEWE